MMVETLYGREHLLHDVREENVQTGERQNAATGEPPDRQDCRGPVFGSGTVGQHDCKRRYQKEARSCDYEETPAERCTASSGSDTRVQPGDTVTDHEWGLKQQIFHWLPKTPVRGSPLVEEFDSANGCDGNASRENRDSERKALRSNESLPTDEDDPEEGIDDSDAR